MDLRNRLIGKFSGGKRDGFPLVTSSATQPSGAALMRALFQAQHQKRKRVQRDLFFQNCPKIIPLQKEAILSKISVVRLRRGTSPFATVSPTKSTGDGGSRRLNRCSSEKYSRSVPCSCRGTRSRSMCLSQPITKQRDFDLHSSMSLIE